jgi:predicted permease
MDVRRLLRRTAFWLHGRRHAADLAAELEDHRARLQQAYEADGLPPVEAARRSRRAMGNMTLAREDARHVWIAGALERIWCDARYGVRALRREPAFAATALLTLTLGIATTTTVFTVVDSEQWKPLPFPDADRLVAVRAMKPGAGADSERVSVADFEDWQSQSRLAVYGAETGYGRRVLRRGSAESVRVLPVTANYFEVFHHVPRLGRAFASVQDAHARVAILSDAGWQRLFDGNPSALGTVLTLDGDDYTVVGINAGQHFGLGDDPDVYITLDLSAQPRDRTARVLSVVGRVAPGATSAQAQAELTAVMARIAASYPEDHAGHRVEFSDLRRAFSGNNWRPLFFFLGAAAMVLLLSCLNVANLLLARALRRQREFAIRGALGGGHWALVRQLMVEGALLALPSAAAGALLSAWALRVFDTQIPPEYLERGAHFDGAGRITIFVVLITALTTGLLSLTPLFFARRIELNLMLGHGGRAGRSLRQVRTRTALLVAQLTVTLVLMMAAGLFVRSFVRLIDVPLGFDPADRLAVRVTLSGSLYGGDAPVRLFAERLLERGRAVPGVVDAAIDSTSPLDSGPLVRLAAADRPRPAPGSEQTAIMRSVSPDYFRTLGMTPIAGRSFSSDDGVGAPRVAIVNAYLASRLFPNENAVGQRLDLVPGARVPWTRRPGVVTIVAVVSNIKDVGLNEVEFGDIYLPFAQAPAPGLELLVRSTLAPAQVAASLRRAVADVDPALPVVRVQTLDERLDLATQADRFNMLLIAGFALVAIVLAVVGVYGAMACAVQERTREFGVRLALGQPPASIVRNTLWQSARLGVVGGGIGVAIVLVIARLLGNALYLVRGEHNGLLYGVTTTDPAAIAAAVCGLVVAATLAGVVPARAATRVDPLVALRTE